MSSSEATALPTFPDRFNLCDCLFDRDLREGRADEVALLCGAESRTFAHVSARAQLGRTREELDLFLRTRGMGPWMSPGGAR